MDARPLTTPTMTALDSGLEQRPGKATLPPGFPDRRSLSADWFFCRMVFLLVSPQKQPSETSALGTVWEREQVNGKRFGQSIPFLGEAGGVGKLVAGKKRCSWSNN